MFILIVRRPRPRYRYRYARPRPRPVFAYREPSYAPWTWSATVLGVVR